MSGPRALCSPGGARCLQRAGLSGLRAIHSTFGTRIMFGTLALLLASPASAQSNAFSPLSGEATVTNTQGRVFRGELRGFINGQVTLVSREGAGEITRRFIAADVRAIEFPGYELVATAADLVSNGRWPEARGALETLAKQRGPYLEVLNASDLGLFLALIEARMHTHGEIDAIALARRLEQLDAATDRRTELSDMILLGYWQLGLEAEADPLAREWCAKNAPGGRSALGWRVLAEIALHSARNEDALWIALQPIAYGSFEYPSQLDACYAIAVTAAVRIADLELAKRIRREMDTHGLDWPAAFAEPDLSATARDAGLSAPASSKKPDLHLSLDQVRKLVVQTPES